MLDIKNESTYITPEQIPVKTVFHLLGQTINCFILFFYLKYK